MPDLTPEQLAQRRRINRRILMFLVGPIGLVFLWLATFGMWFMLVPAAICLFFAVGAYFMRN